MLYMDNYNTIFIKRVCPYRVAALAQQLSAQSG